MTPEDKKPATVDEYLARVPLRFRALLRNEREVTNGTR
jgi:hypothetical protein